MENTPNLKKSEDLSGAVGKCEVAVFFSTEKNKKVTNEAFSIMAESYAKVSLSTNSQFAHLTDGDNVAHNNDAGLSCTHLENLADIRRFPKRKDGGIS